MLRAQLQRNRQVYERFLRQAAAWAQEGEPESQPATFTHPLAWEAAPAAPQPEAEPEPGRVLSATPLPYRLDLRELTQRMEYDNRRRCQAIDNDQELLD